MRLLSVLLTCVVFAASPAYSQAVVEHFVGPPVGPGFRDAIGTLARFSAPAGVSSDGESLYIVDTGNAMIRKMSLATSQVTTLAGRESGTFIRPAAVWTDGQTVYVTDGGLIREVDVPTGAVSLFVDNWSPEGLLRIFVSAQPFALTGNSGSLYALYSRPLSGSSFVPIGTPTIRQISRSTGEARTISPASYGGVVPAAFWADEQYLYFVYTTTSEISMGRMNLSTEEFEPLFGFPPTPSNLGQREGAGARSPLGLWGDTAGHLFFADSRIVYQVDLSTGLATQIATAPPSAVSARIGGLTGAGGFLYLTDNAANTVFRVDVAQKRGDTIAGLAPTSAPAPIPPSSTLFGIRGIWSDGKYIYAADEPANVIRKIDRESGQSSIFASNIHSPSGIWGDAVYIYVTQSADRIITKVSLATGDTSLLASGLSQPTVITGDTDFLYVADNAAILRVSKSTGATTTLAGQSGISGYANGIGTAARFSAIWGLWTDGSVIYATDTGSIRRIVIATQEVGTFAGSGFGVADGTALGARFGFPTSLASDGTYLYVGDSGTIRRVALSTADVTTIAGTPPGLPSSDRFGFIQGLWIDGRFLWAADGRLRKLDLSTRMVTTITGENIVLSSGAFPADQFDTQTLTGGGGFLYSMTGSALYKIALRTRAITHVAGAFNEDGEKDGRGNQARFPSGANVVWSDGRFAYVDDYVNLKIRRVDTQTGDVATIISDFSIGAAWSDGKYLYGLNTYGGSLDQIDLTTGQKTTLVASGLGLYAPAGIWGDATYLYVPDGFNCVVQKITRATGEMRVLSGRPENCRNVDVQLPPIDGTGPAAFFPSLRAITGDGNLLYVMDGTTIRSIDPQTGETHTIAGDYRISGTDDGAGSEAHFLSGRTALWSDGTNLYVANRAIRRVILTHPLSQVSFNFSAAGGDYWKTASGTGTLGAGFGRLHVTGGNTAPRAVAIFSHRVNGILVSEASVPASVPVHAGRIYVEVSGSVNTGIALANANSQAATLSFYFTDAAGVNFGAGTTTIEPNSQFEAFLDQAPFRPVDSTSALAQARSFTFSSSMPVGVVALRGYTNERSEFLMTTLPVGPIGSSSTSSVLLPHFADGGGWRTQVLLVNPTDQIIRGTVEMDSVFNYTIAPRSSVKIPTPGAATSVHSGTVRITPLSFGEPAPIASTVFSFRQAGIVVTESGASTNDIDRSFRLLAETGAVHTALAVTNTVTMPGALQFTILDFTGNQVAASTPVSITGGGRMSLFIDEIPGFQNLPSDFRGILTVSADVPIAIIGARGRYNERGEFLIATTPALAADSLAFPADSIFPHIVAGEEFTTEFFLLSGGTASGTVDFISQSGQALSLPIQR